MLILILLLGGIGIVIAIELAIWIKIALIVGIVLYSYYAIWRYGLLKSSSSIIKLSYHSSSWQIGTRYGMFPVELCGDSTVTNLLCILRFTIPGSRWKQSCVICRDSVTKDQYRRLVVALRM